MGSRTYVGDIAAESVDVGLTHERHGGLELLSHDADELADALLAIDVRVHRRAAESDSSHAER